ncbi:MAG: hypothetical protein AAF170_07895 [Bacteroidota bacterium]
MTTLQLRVRADDVTHTYVDDDMGEESVAAERAYEEGQIEQGDVSIEVQSPTLIGIASPLAMGSERHRAELRDTGTDTVLINGTLDVTGIVADDPAETDGLRVWTARVVDTALADFLAALKGVSLRSLAPTVSALADGYSDVETDVSRESGSTDRTSVRWWNMRRLLEAALEAAGATSVVVPELFPLSVRYTSTATSEVETVTAEDRGYVAFVGPLQEGQTVNDPGSTIPDVTGLDWWRTLRDLLSLTLDVRYDAWPSTNLEATVSIDLWVEPDVAVLSKIDAPGTERLVLNGWDIETDPPEKPDFAIQFANELDEAGLGGSSPSPFGARFASGQSAFSTGVPGTDSTVALRQPRYTDLATSDQDGYTIHYGRPYLDGTVSEPYIAWLQGVGLTHALHCYSIETPPTDAPARVNPVWATALFAGHALTAWNVQRVQVELDADRLRDEGVAQPDLLATQYALEGYGFRTESVATDPDSGELDVTLARPGAGYATEAATALVGPPTLVARVDYWFTLDQAGDIDQDGYHSSASVSPGLGLSTPDRYEVEYSLASPAVWPGTPGQYVDLGGSSQDVHWRARSIYEAEGFTSDWVYATAED